MFSDLPHDRGNSFGRQCKNPPLRGTALKRVFDVTSASLGLVLLSPVLGSVALAVRLSTRGPVLFRQTRGARRRRISSCSSSRR